MNEYINLTLENIDDEHICCAIGDLINNYNLFWNINNYEKEK